MQTDKIKFVVVMAVILAASSQVFAAFTSRYWETPKLPKQKHITKRDVAQLIPVFQKVNDIGLAADGYESVASNLCERAAWIKTNVVDRQNVPLSCGTMLGGIYGCCDAARSYGYYGADFPDLEICGNISSPRAFSMHGLGFGNPSISQWYEEDGSVPILLEAISNAASVCYGRDLQIVLPANSIAQIIGMTQEEKTNLYSFTEQQYEYDPVHWSYLYKPKLTYDWLYRMMRIPAMVKYVWSCERPDINIIGTDTVYTYERQYSIECEQDERTFKYTIVPAAPVIEEYSFSSTNSSDQSGWGLHFSRSRIQSASLGPFGFDFNIKCRANYEVGSDPDYGYVYTGTEMHEWKNSGVFYAFALALDPEDNTTRTISKITCSCHSTRISDISLMEGYPALKPYWSEQDAPSYYNRLTYVPSCCNTEGRTTVVSSFKGSILNDMRYAVLNLRNIYSSQFGNVETVVRGRPIIDPDALEYTIIVPERHTRACVILGEQETPTPGRYVYTVQGYGIFDPVNGPVYCSDIPEEYVFFDLSVYPTVIENDAKNQVDTVETDIFFFFRETVCPDNLNWLQ